MTREEYLNWLAPRVVLDSLNRNLLPSVRIAQGCFEPAYGTTELAVKANNLFGVKANDQWEGEVYNKVSGECYDGKNYESVASDFQKYDSWEDSIYWQGWYLENRCTSLKYHPEIKHYAELIGNRDYKDCARILQEKCYGTSPEYAKRVIDYVEKHDLTQYDTMTKEEALAMISKESEDVSMGNSPLVDYKCISPNSTNPRNNKIKKITIHHMAGNLSVETCGNVFVTPDRKASSNYGIGTDGRVGMYVEECNRAWTSGSRDNDNQAVTIEVANDEIGGNWHVSDKALSKLILLCADICQRNGIEKLNYTGDVNGNLTMHKWFQATNCPGPYLESKFPYIASEVNKLLGVEEKNDVLYKTQIGAFLIKKNAENLKAELEKKGIDSIIKKEGIYHKVQTGAYRVKANAEAMKKKLADMGYKAIIVEVKG